MRKKKCDFFYNTVSQGYVFRLLAVTTIKLRWQICTNFCINCRKDIKHSPDPTFIPGDSKLSY